MAYIEKIQQLLAGYHIISELQGHVKGLREAVEKIRCTQYKYIYCKYSLILLHLMSSCVFLD